MTLLRGLVLARSAFEHSANYECVIALGRFKPVDDRAGRLAALEAFTEKLLPGRWREVRGPDPGELKATVVLSMPLTEAAVKTRSGPPDDDDSADAELNVWAGVIPLSSSYGKPEPSPGLRRGIALSPSAARLVESTDAHRHRDKLSETGENGGRC